jgi:endonuclease-3
MKHRRTTRRILDLLEEQHPQADTELSYQNPFELLVATVLSAQSSDVRVNLVTPALFARYPDSGALAAANTEELESQIVSTGFYKQKSRSLIGLARALIANHGGRVPADMSALTALPGVGRKTANVVLGHALEIPAFPVDRHVIRVANRLGIVSSEDPVVIERKLCGLLSRERWVLASDVMILHGRRICRPMPRCDECFVCEDCNFWAITKRSAADPRVGSYDSAALSRRNEKKRIRTPRR